jgi:hypothetical protein
MSAAGISLETPTAAQFKAPRPESHGALDEVAAERRKQTDFK